LFKGDLDRPSCADWAARSTVSSVSDLLPASPYKARDVCTSLTPPPPSQPLSQRSTVPTNPTAAVRIAESQGDRETVTLTRVLYDCAVRLRASIRPSSPPQGAGAGRRAGRGQQRRRRAGADICSRRLWSIERGISWGLCAVMYRLHTVIA
jgi:hypothetical protein